MGRDKHRASVMTSKSSFLLEVMERRISRGYCRDIGPGTIIFLYFRPMVQPEDEGLSEEEKSLFKKTVLVNKG